MEGIMHVRFHHKGKFFGTNYVGGERALIPNIDSDRFSYTVLMELVKDTLQYIEIGGIYVRNDNEIGGWKMVTNDADLSIVKKVKSGGLMNFYLDNNVDAKIEPLQQMQPHVVIRPRPNIFEATTTKNTTRKFVTTHQLQEQTRKKKSVEVNNAVMDENDIEDEYIDPILPPPVPMMTMYEWEKAQTVERNNEMLKALNLPTLVAGLRHTGKKNKEKENMRDEDEYIPQIEEHNEDDTLEILSRKNKKVKENKHLTGPTTRMQANLLGETNKALYMATQGASSGCGSSGNGDSLVNQITSSSEKGKRKGRGLAKKSRNWGKKKLMIDFDANGNPCGGKYKKLATQLGYFVKDGISFPLTTERWDEMDLTIIEKVWQDIQKNTNVPVEAKKHCIDSMGAQWRDWKCRVKKRGYYAFSTDKERLVNCPLGVVENHWPALVSMWGKQEVQKRAKVNMENRSKSDFLPHTGKKPMSVLKKERADKGLPTDRVHMFIASREGAKDVTTKRMINELEVIRDELKEVDNDTPEALENVFIDKFGEDKHGRMRCLGRGITPTMVYGRKCGVPITSAETVAAICAEFEEKFESQKHETEARIKAEREAYRIEMELKMEAFKQEMLSQLQSKTG